MGVLDNVPIPSPLGIPLPTFDQAVPDKKVKLSELVSGRDWDTRTAVAIILAESRGRIGAVNINTNGTRDYGLFQVNSIHKQFDAKRLRTDAKYNVDAAYAIYQDSKRSSGDGWLPWTTYKSGAFRQFLGKDATITLDKRSLANPADAVSAAGDVAEGVTDGLDAIGNVIGALANPSTWMRLGKGALGGVLIIVGVGTITFVVANRIPTPATKVIKNIT